ncbi:NACHT domain-containing protein [Actinomycetospora sp. OC33-EN08]|uniref:NACHT domain-containing protein n=1 Tax=Actinomycetospora aurantiaca TaxID=3129233 RepID=A0ABU8MVY2_9PSEU
MAGAVAGSALALSVAVSVVVNYATQDTPSWLADGSTRWLVLVVLVLVSVVVAVLGARAGTAPRDPAALVAAGRIALAARVRSQWEDELRLRRLFDPYPMPVRWQSVPDLGDRPTESEFRGDRVDALVEDLLARRRPRLVVLGVAGSGKTTLAAQVVVETLRQREDDDPVPVLLALAEWDLDEHPELWSWLAEHLDREHPVLRGAGAGTAAALVAGRHVLPVLDGLDEVPEDARPDLITALNDSLGDTDGVVLTSRTAEYREAVRRSNTVTSALVVEGQSLPSTAVADYLEQATPLPQRSQWQPVVDRLRAGDAGFAAAAATPLDVWLVRTVLLEGDEDPAALLDAASHPGAPAVRTRLLRGLLAAVYERERRLARARGERVRELDVIARWLVTLAVDLDAAGERELRWWRLPEPKMSDGLVRRLIRRTVAGFLGALLTTLVVYTVLAPIGVALRAFGVGAPEAVYVSLGTLSVLLVLAGFATGVLLAGGRRRRRADRVLFALGITVGAQMATPVEILIATPVSVALRNWGATLPSAGVLATVASVVGVLVTVLGAEVGRRVAAARSTSFPVRADFRLRGRLRALAALQVPGIAMGIVLAGAMGLVLAPSATVGVASAVWAAAIFIGIVALTAVLVALVWAIPAWARTDRAHDAVDTPRSTLRADRTYAALRAASWFVALCVLIGMDATALLPALPGSLGFGLFGFIVFVGGGLVLTVGGTAWTRYLTAVMRRALRRRSPWRLMPFLQDMHRWGLLRAVGSTYQFRHAELQDHLAGVGRDQQATPRTGEVLRASATAED